ncbi:hypothetical protein SI855_002838 [Clostridioides difficile]|nr:hypothetical protein [Clostridioides difficile]
MLEKLMFSDNNNFYTESLDKILNLDKFYMLSFIETKGSPVIIPITLTDYISIMLFEEETLANKYLLDNKIDKIMFVSEIKLNSLLLLLNNLFYRGLSGIIFNTKIEKDYYSYYYSIFDIFNKTENFNNTLIKEDNINLIRSLNNVLFKNEYIYYIYHNTLSVQDILNCIIRYNIYNDSKGLKFIRIFLEEKEIEDYCKKNKIIDNSSNDYPITTIPKENLFNSLVVLINREKVDYVNVFSKGKMYTVGLNDFITLIINIGFKQVIYD